MDSNLPQPDGDDQYAAFKPSDGTLMIYDIDNHEAHVQSDCYVALEE